MSAGMQAPNAVRRPCKQRPPGHIKAHICGQNPQDEASFCVGRNSRKRLTVQRLTESGEQPPTELALLLLALPLLFTLQK
jgi:hypothetical protein